MMFQESYKDIHYTIIYNKEKLETSDQQNRGLIKW